MRAVGYRPGAGLHEMSNEVTQQHERRNHESLIYHVHAHTTGKYTGSGLSGLSLHDVRLRLFDAQRERREAVRHKIYPQQMHGLEYSEAHERSCEYAYDLAHVGAEQKLYAFADIVVYPASLFNS